MEAADLMKFGEVGCIQRLVSKNTIDGEILDRLEFSLLPELIQHAGADSSRVCPKNVL